MLPRSNRISFDVRRDKTGVAVTRSVALAILGIIVLLATAWTIGAPLLEQRAWFGVHREQLATIRKLNEFPPAGWTKHAWNNVVTTTHNVWGNVIYHPASSGLKHPEMVMLKHQLERIVAETNTDNSIESIEAVYTLLLQHGRKADFIIPYRDEFRESTD